MTITYRGCISAMKSARIPSLLREGAMICNLEIRISSEKRWFSEDVFFTVIGNKESVERFITGIKHSLRSYNRVITGFG